MRLYVFIDSSNLWQAQKAKGRFLDYKKLQDFLIKKHGSSLIKVFYYTAYPGTGTRSYDLEKRHKFFTFLKKSLGFVVRKKELKRIHIMTKTGTAIEEKGNMDVEMTIDVLHYVSEYDKAVFFTGDSDFLALILHIQRNGKKVHVYSSRNNISRELRTGADEYTDVLTIEESIWGRELHR
jgi:uncharacterized LabA/DUF88 family protein